MSSPQELLIKSCRVVVGESVTELQTHLNQYAATPAPGSPYLADQQPLRTGGSPRDIARLRVYQHGFLALQHVVVSAMDHLRSIHVLMADDLPPLFAGTTLARAAGEAAAQVLHRLDSNLTSELRLLRFAASLHHGLQDQTRGAKGLPEASVPRQAGVLEACEAQLADVEAILDECGMDVGKAGLTSRSTGESAPFRVQLSGLAQAVFPHRASWYNSTSGTAHSQPWALGTVNKGFEDNHLLFGANPLELGGAVILALDACTVIDSTYAAYFGHDPARATDTYQHRSAEIDTALLNSAPKALKHEMAVRLQQAATTPR